MLEDAKVRKKANLCLYCDDSMNISSPTKYHVFGILDCYKGLDVMLSICLDVVT